MSLNDTPMANRLHIAFFGRRNAGKSSLLNAVTGQDMAVVSSQPGTTTDPVYKSMELLPLGPVVIIDTAGIDDAGELGELRVKKTRQVLGKCDAAVLVTDSVEQTNLTEDEKRLTTLFREHKIPYVVARSKADLLPAWPEMESGEDDEDADYLYVSAKTGKNVYELKELIARVIARAKEGEGTERHFVADFVHPMDLIVTVMPQDKAAPKGRLILPEQMAVRDVLDAGGISLSVRETEYGHTIETLCAQKKKPALVITDSQAFEQIARDTPPEIPLTSFSILMARYKGFLRFAVEGVKTLDTLRDGDTVLISEGCTHHRQCNDIGTVKLPLWLKKYTGKELRIATSSGGGFPEDLSPFRLVLHCGGCMLNAREVLTRAERARMQGVPMTNYGTAIAQMHGILARSLTPLNGDY